MAMLEKKRILTWLISFNILLIFLYLMSNHTFLVHSYTIGRWFDLNAEANIPTWFSSAQLFSIFILSIVCSGETEDKHLSKFYLLIGLLFLFFSVDETSMVHEGITNVFKQLSIRSFFPNNHGMWILVYSAILIVLGFVYRKGLLAFWSEKNGSVVFTAGAAIFVTGGVGAEVIGYYLELDKKDAETIFYTIEVIAEESLELLGQSLMIYGLLSKLDFTRTGNTGGSH